MNKKSVTKDEPLANKARGIFLLLLARSFGPLALRMTGYANKGDGSIFPNKGDGSIFRPEIDRKNRTVPFIFKER